MERRSPNDLSLPRPTPSRPRGWTPRAALVAVFGLVLVSLGVALLSGAARAQLPDPVSEPSPTPPSAPAPTPPPAATPAPAPTPTPTPTLDAQASSPEAPQPPPEPSSLPLKDPTLIFAIVLLLILFAPLIMGKFRLPGMIALLLAGALLGPNALGVLARDKSFELFGTVGLLYIMFTAALEIDLHTFRKSKSHSMVFGALTFIIPQGAGTLIAWALLGFDWPAAILMGSVFASHTLLAYPIASRLGLAKNRAVTAAIGGTILTDTVALLVLAVIAGMSRGEVNEAFWYKLIVLMSLYVGGILYGLPRLARWFFRHVARDGVSEFVFVLAAVFACAALSHVAGVEPIVGAFLAGLALNRLIPPASALMSRIHFTGEAIFIPFFLLSVGMLLDVRIFAGGARSWLIAIFMLATVTLAKWAAAELMRLWFKYSKEEARVMFGLSVAQAAATLAAVMVGHEIGLFDDAVVNGAILMIIGTCTLAPWVVDRYGRAIAQSTQTDDEAELTRPQRVIVGLSNPAYAQPLLELSALLRDHEQAQPLFPVNVIEETGDDIATAVTRGERMLSNAVVHLAAADVPASPVTRVDLSVPAGLLRAARELRGSDIVVRWSEKASAQEFFFGSFLEKLLEDPNHTVIVSRLIEPLKLVQRLVVMLPPDADLDRSFPTAIHTIKHLAKNTGAPITFLVEAEQRDRVARRIDRINRTRPTVQVSYQAIESWSSVIQALADGHRDGDLTIFYALREALVGWRPLGGLGITPTRVARRFPGRNLLAIYPAVDVEDEARALAPDSQTRLVDILNVERIRVEIPRSYFADASLQLLGLADANLSRHDTAELVERLAERSRLVAPDCLFAQATHPALTREHLLLGVSREGVTGPGALGDARLLFLHLAPEAVDSSRALSALTGVAHAVQDEGAVRSALAADSPEEVLSALTRPPSTEPASASGADS